MQLSGRGCSEPRLPQAASADPERLGQPLIDGWGGTGSVCEL
jgi:hypothetical protein